MAEVDLVVNTFEKTYREVLGSDLLKKIEADNRFEFARLVVLINNVEDRAAARDLAEEATERGAITSFAFVDSLIEAALEKTGVSIAEIERTRHFTDCALVAVTMDGSPWLLYWDADVRMQRPCNWVSPALDLMSADRRVMAANPQPLEVRPLEVRDDFVLTQGFSDQVFLCRRSDFAAPIYQERCIARWRYPMIAIEPIFEARVDSWMRHHGRLRAVFMGASYVHPRHDEGDRHPGMTIGQRLRRFLGLVVIAALRRSPRTPYCCRAI